MRRTLRRWTIRPLEYHFHWIYSDESDRKKPEKKRFVIYDVSIVWFKSYIMSIWSNVYTKVLMIARFSFTIISAFCVIVPTDATKIRVLVTGGTGTLGRSLVKGALNRDCDTYFTYRDLNKAQSLGADLSNGLYLDLANLNQVGFSISQNFECLQALPSFEDCDEYVLINNIGIGLSGHTQTALIKSLRINCLATVSVSEFLVDRLRKWLVSHSTRPKLTVINVSSGDGELVFLYSNIRQQIESLDSIKVSNIRLFISYE